MTEQERETLDTTEFTRLLNIYCHAEIPKLRKQAIAQIEMGLQLLGEDLRRTTPKPFSSESERKKILLYIKRLTVPANEEKEKSI